MPWFADSTLKETSLTVLLNTIERMIEQIEAYFDWQSASLAREELIKAKCEGLVKLLEGGELNPEDADAVLRFAIAERRWDFARTTQGQLQKILGTDRHELVNNFQKLEKDRFSKVQQVISKLHLSQVPKGAVGPMGTILGEIKRRRRNRSIRRMMTEAGIMIQRIKPVFLMSPTSVAQFLPPGELEFDLLVIDEASQVKPEEALGCIARAKQIVVVGDQKQLPPTTFFDRLTDDEPSEDDEDLAVGVKATEIESILSLCEARGLQPMYARVALPLSRSITHQSFKRGVLSQSTDPAAMPNCVR